MDEQAAGRIKRFLKANGYDMSKSEIAWILNQMTELLDRQIEDKKFPLPKFWCKNIAVRNLILVIIPTRMFENLGSL